MDELLNEYEEMTVELAKETAMRKQLEAEQFKMMQMKNTLMGDFAGEADALQGNFYVKLSL